MFLIYQNGLYAHMNYTYTMLVAICIILHMNYNNSQKIQNVLLSCLCSHFLLYNQGLTYRSILLGTGGTYQYDRGLIWVVHRYTLVYHV